MKKKKQKSILIKIAAVFAFFVIIKIAAGLIIDIVLPMNYYDTVKKYSKEYNLDPALVSAVIRVESSYKANAESSRGASGLMQLMKQTADWGAEELGIEDYSYDNILNPELNIRIGCWYLRNLIDQFGNVDVALAAYNGGSGNVSKWLNDEKYSADNKSLDDIPFPETKRYVQKVKNYFNLYANLIKARGESYEKN